MVVGETPYAEGFGDVGGPLWRDNGVPREPKAMRVNDADRAAVDRVCGEIEECVVVSGRPLILTDQLRQMDALVAAWLSGSQGEGVADVLFGRRPFTGRLSMTWLRGLEQEPINVGDRDYDPLFPYGWGCGRAEAEGEAGGQQDAGVVHELEVQVGLGGVAGVAALGQLLAGGDPVADPHPERAAAQVGQGGVDPAAQVEHQVVAEDAAGAEQLADRPLDGQVEQGRRRGPAPVAEAIVAGALELFEARGFERTTVDQIAAAADISRRTFFRYFADKEELFFAEDERLLAVIGETLDGAPAGGPVLELARRATRALAAHSAADPERRLARERLIAATPALQARRMAKTLRWEEAIAARLLARGSTEEEALLVPKLALACFQTAYQRWVRDPGQDLPGLVDDSFAALARLTG